MLGLETYLAGHTQVIRVNGTGSDPVDLQTGVPQGSVLGVILFSIYMLPVGDILRRYGVSYHIYADDTQIYTSFNPRESKSLCAGVQRRENCIMGIRTWMAIN